MSIRDLLGDLRDLVALTHEMKNIADEQLRQRQQLAEHGERLARLETAMQLAVSGRLRLPKGD